MISAIILTKNEEGNIKECLGGLLWCNEILVVDDDSGDSTVKIAKEMGARVILHPLNEDFSKQRNFSLSQAKYDWILFVDGDERVSDRLAKEIQYNLLKEKNGLGKIGGFYMRRYDYFLGKLLKHGETANVKLLRLARRGSGIWQRKVDEVWVVEGEIKTLKNPLMHFSHPNLTQFLESINRRSTMNAEEFYSQGKKIAFLDWFKPLAKFVSNYLFKIGFLDGVAGFVFAVLMCLHSFLVRGKLYLLWKKEGGWK